MRPPILTLISLCFIMGSQTAGADDSINSFQSDKQYLMATAKAARTNHRIFACKELKTLSTSFKALGDKLGRGHDFQSYQHYSDGYSTFTKDYQPAIFDAYDLGHRLFVRIPGIDQNTKPGPVHNCRNMAITIVNKLRSFVDHYADIKQSLKNTSKTAAASAAPGKTPVPSPTPVTMSTSVAHRKVAQNRR